MKILLVIVEFAVTIITIGIAVAATAGLLDNHFLQGQWEFKVVFLTLSLIAIENFVQRIGVLYRIDKNVSFVETIKNKLGLLDSIKKDVEDLSSCHQPPLFSNRNGLNQVEQFPTFIEKTQKDILFIGLTHVGIAGQYARQLKKLKSDGKIVRFLLLDPNRSDLDILARAHLRTGEVFKNEVDNVQKQLTNMGFKIDDNIRFIKSIPYASLVVRDGKNENGKIRYEMYLYGEEVDDRPAFELSYNQEEAYKTILRSAEQLWENSKSSL